MLTNSTLRHKRANKRTCNGRPTRRVSLPSWDLACCLSRCARKRRDATPESQTQARARANEKPPLFKTVQLRLFPYLKPHMMFYPEMGPAAAAPSNPAVLVHPGAVPLIVAVPACHRLHATSPKSFGAPFSRGGSDNTILVRFSG